MHILESYSLNCGAKIDKPFVYESLFPLPFEKFIVFAPNAKVPGKEYNYFQDVINNILPFLEKNNIKIIHLGPKNSLNYENVINICGQTTFNQTAFIINKSMAVFGCDGIETQMAGVQNIPVISINSITYSQNTGPFFGNKEKQKIFESYKRTQNKKASFNAQESPKSINLIKPEEIAQSILENLEIDFQFPFETVYSGPRYGANIVQEVVPDSKNIVFHPESLVEIRVDEEYDEENLMFQLSNYKKAVVVTDREININILNQLKRNIQMFVFKITKKDHFDFLNKVKSIGLNLYLISEMPKEDIALEKIKYYEFGNINRINEINEELVNNLKKDIDKLFYKSCKRVNSKDKIYFSLAAKRNNIPIRSNFEYQKVIDSPEFWKNLDFFTIVKLKS